MEEEERKRIEDIEEKLNGDNIEMVISLIVINAKIYLLIYDTSVDTGLQELGGPTPEVCHNQFRAPLNLQGCSLSKIRFVCV